jgi:L-ascorbate metabolism protein UlaG (beta-lactamase superfamily)
MFGTKIISTYIANSGVLFQHKDKKILVDGVHTKQCKPYYNVDADILEKMVLNNAPLNNIDVLLFTHHHPDHFDPDMCIEILKRNKHLQLIGPDLVMSLIKQCSGYNEILDCQLWSMEVPNYKSIDVRLKDIPFQITALSHDGEIYAGVTNYAYMFELKNKVILHLGDAQPSVSNFEKTGIFESAVDYLFVPFPFIGLSEGREIINRIDPTRVFVMHLPDKQYDATNWLLKTYKVYKKYQSDLPDTEMLTKPGQTFRL